MSGQRLPDFLIIGAQKAGTTWLKAQLRAHSEVFMCRDEVHFFDHDDRFARGPEWYGTHFLDAAADKLIGEKTPEYLYLSESIGVPDGARRVHDLLPAARLIALFRDPVTRALSAVNHMITRHHISPLHSVDSLLLGRKRRLLPWPVIEMGMYERQLAPFLDLYGQQAVLTLFYEDDIVAAPETGLYRVCDFLGIGRELDVKQFRMRVNRPRRSRVGLIVDHYAPVPSSWTSNRNWLFPQYYPRLSDEARQELYALYQPFNERLFELLGRRPASGWSYVPDQVDE